jgi:hypothetical protein
VCFWNRMKLSETFHWKRSWACCEVDRAWGCASPVTPFCLSCCF